MVETITEWQRRSFRANFIYVFQQKVGLVYPTLDAMNIQSGVGVMGDFDVMGAMIHHDMTVRHGDTVIGNAEHGRVWCRPYPSDAALYLDREDKIRSAISDPNSAHVNTIAWSLVRAKDKRIIDAATGSVLYGESGTSTLAFDTTNQQIALGSTPNDVLTLDKIKLASVKLADAGVPDDEGQRFFFYAAGQTRAILAITQAASSDFTAQRIYESGTINGKYWMGFAWKMIPDVTTQNADGTITRLLRMLKLSGTTRSCLAIAKTAMGFAETSGMETFLDVLPQKQHLTQARAKIDNNAVRILQNGVVEVLAKEEVS